MIEVKDLVKLYGSFRAVDHLSFTVGKGQIYGFLGPNGAGKSTTMNMITGYISATEGTVRIDGHDIFQEPEKAKARIGYLPEIPPVYPDMTAREYLAFAGELKRVPGKGLSKEVERVMGLTGITHMKMRLIKNLSKGYRQRVGLACALLGDPPVIILDEPTVGLDPKQIIEIRDLIRRLGENHTIILSSHILSEVSAVCDHIMIIAHGKLIASDSPQGLQKLMSDSAGLYLEVKGTYEQVNSVLLGIPQVETVENNGEAEGDCVKVTISAKENTDVREAVFYTLAEARLPLMGMKNLVKSLEDIFLELTEQADSENVSKSGKKGHRAGHRDIPTEKRSSQEDK